MRKLMSAVVACFVAVGLLVVVGVAPASAISDGRDASEAYPFMGAFKPDGGGPGPGGNACGVTLIAPQWAITAAHCGVNSVTALASSPKRWTVQLGSADVTSGGETIAIDRYFRKSNGRGEAGADVMLFRLAQPATGTPIDIASTTPLPGTAGRILGWGDTCADVDRSEGTCEPTYPSQLQELDVKVGAPDCVEKMIKRICVDSVDGSFRGKSGIVDSGGPLLVKEEGAWRIAGVLEGTSEDSSEEGVGLYKDVTADREWVQMIMDTWESIPDSPADWVRGTASLGGCAASIVRTLSSQDDDPALLLTNGHCVEGVDPEAARPEPGQALTDQKVIGASVGIIDEYGYGLTESAVEKLVYATMTGTDIAVYQLGDTYRALQDRGARVLTIADRGPRVGDNVFLIADSGLDCTVEAIVPHLREEGYDLTNALRMTSSETCLTRPGMSGSPIIQPDTTSLVAIYNTANRDEDPCSGEVEEECPPPTEDCDAGKPCEVSADGAVRVFKDQPYAQQVSEINDCFTTGSQLALTNPHCTLTAGAGAASPPGTSTPSDPHTGSTVPWGIALTAAAIIAIGLALTLYTRHHKKHDHTPHEHPTSPNP